VTRGAQGIGVATVRRLSEDGAAVVALDLEQTAASAAVSELRNAIVCKVRHEGVVKNRAAHLAVGVDADGRKEVLGIWVETTEGAKFWLRVLNEVKARGVEDVLIVVCDGLTGLPAAVNAVCPETSVRWLRLYRPTITSPSPWPGLLRSSTSAGRLRIATMSGSVVRDATLVRRCGRRRTRRVLS
jgi:hypothetical protein